MIKHTYPLQGTKEHLRCQLFRPEKISRLFYSLLLFLLYSPSFSQVAHTTQAGVIEAGFGITPNLTGASSVAVKGNYAYVVGTGDVLQILDITLPGLPAPKASLANGVGGAVIQRPQHIVVQGNYAYITSEAANALEIVDISNPAQPVHKSVIYDGKGSAPYLSSPWGLAVSGNYAYVTFATGLEIIDISNPALPVHKGSILDGGGSAPYLLQAVTVFISGNLAYVGTLGSLEIIDISNPALPVHKGALLDGGGIAPFLLGSYSLSVSGNYAYVTDITHWAVEIVDISNPALPVHAASMVHNATTGPYLQYAFGLTVSGNYLYVVGNSKNFEIIDISNPLQPVHKGGFTNNTLVGGAREIVIVGKYAYVPSRNSAGLAIVDISNPSSTTIKGSAISGSGGAALSGAQAAVIDGKYAYIANTAQSPTISGFEIVDISNPAVPLHTSSIPQDNGANTPSTIGVYSASKSGNFVLLANHMVNGVALVDVTNPLTPYQRSILYDGQNGAKLRGAISIQVHPTIAGQAYVASEYSDAIATVNFVDPSNLTPQSVITDGNGTFPYLKKPTSIAVQYIRATTTTPNATYGYVTSAGSHALEILNLGMNAHKGSLLDGNGSAPFLKFPKSIFLRDNYAYIADYGSSALEIVDITNPAAPVHKGSLKSPILDSLNSVYVSGNYAYITCAAVDAAALPVGGRLVVVDISNPANPVHYETFTSGTGGSLLDYPTSVNVSGGYAYITNAGLFDAFNIVYLYGPDITSFSPASAAVGSTVTVMGKNFNTFITASIDGIPAAITEITENTITLVVPPGATNGPITLEYAGQHFTTTSNFIVIPTTSSATLIQQNNFTANWSDVGAAKYFFDLSTDNFNTFATGYNNLPLGNVTSLVVTGLSPATTYQYRVRSSDGTLISDNSNSTSVLTTPATPVANQSALINQTNFTASWSAVPPATNYFLDVATDDAFTKFLVGYNNLSITATEQSQIVTGLTSFTHYYYRVRAANATGSSPSSNVITVTTLDITAPVISNSIAPNPTTLTFGASPVLNSNITDNVSVDSAHFYYRGISKSSFKKVSMQGPGGLGGNYSITIQPEWYDSLGLEYYFVAKDKAGNKTTGAKSFIQLINPSITIPTLPSGTSQSDYRIIAFPYQLADNKVTSVYNNVSWSDNTKAGLWWWNPNLNSGVGDYDQYGVSTTLQTIDPGKGYWAITSSPVTPTLSNVSAPKYNQSNLYTMTLKPGWNEVGNPYPVPISWDQVIAYNQANNPGASFSALTIYDGSGYKPATGKTLLPAFEGGFVKSLSSSDINIQIPFPGQTTTGGRIASISSDISNEDWNMFLHINQNGRVNQLGGFGMHRLAQSGIDRYDNFNPPSFLGIPEVNFINAEYPSVSFSNDMVQSQDNYTWTFTPDGKQGSTTQLVWNDELNTNSSKQLFLLDEESLTLIDMNAVSQYEFVLTKSSRFRIFYGSDVKITSSRIIASAPFPNPLVSDGKTTINIALPESGSEYFVNLQIYNAQGGVIGSSSRRIAPGIHPLEFTLSPSLSGGIYIYKLAVTNDKTSSIHTGKIVKP